MNLVPQPHGERNRWEEVAERRRPELRELVETKIVPLVADAERDQRFPTEVYGWLGQGGFLSIGAQEEHGGDGGGRTAECMVVEELTRAGAGIAMSVVPFFIVRIAIWEFGSPSVVAEVGEPMIRGERVVGICMSEPDAGSDVASIRTRAVPDGDGWRLDGSKMFITNGTIATDLLVVARTGGSRGDMGLFLLETDQPGYSATKLDKEASRASDTTVLTFDDCRVPAHRVLGSPTEGFRKAMRVLNGERILSVARAVQLARSAWEDAVEWAAQEPYRGRRALEFQAFQGPLAAASAQLWVLGLAMAQACRLWDEGESAVSQISMLKTFGTLQSVEITRGMQELVGWAGQAQDSRIARNARDARLGTVAAGSEQIMHRILARQFGWPPALE